jgi:hypothetical protein
VITLPPYFYKLLITVAPHPTSPKPERPKTFNKRQSLREKRNTRTTIERSTSDGSNSHTSNSDLTSLNNEYPEMPADVAQWSRRRNEASRDPPRPMQVLLHEEVHWNSPPAYETDDNLYELDGEPLIPLEGNGNAVPSTDSLREWREDYRDQEAVQSDEDENIIRAIELSRQEELLSLRSASRSGFDEDQIAEALSRSLHIPPGK